MRLAILLHRYLGIAIGFVIALWCLSGFVMMYVPYPEFTDAERVAGLAPLVDVACCDAASLQTIETALADTELVGLRIEAVAERPILRLRTYYGELAIDLASGAPFDGPQEADITAAGNAFADNYGILGVVTDLGDVERDQWTVYGAYNAHRPLHHFAANDPAGSEWYVSSTTGEVVQLTTSRERFWSWLGSVPHWLYFTALRQHTQLWSQVVIWLTIVSVFLTSLGIYIGIKRLGRRRTGRISPFRGMALWHHYTGLVFGVLVLTWLASGFFSMNPWGALEGRSFGAEYQRVNGGSFAANVPRRVVENLADRAFPADTVRIDSTRFLGETKLVTWRRDGSRTLIDIESAGALPLRALPFETAGTAMRPNTAVAEQGWLEVDDDYYYSHHESAVLPAYRIVYADGERLYLDGTTGELVYAVDDERRWQRWLFAALHRGDFAAALRARPAWDFLMLPLLFGVTLSALTGTWLGARRLLR